jgi:hypothetical protein
LVYTFAFAFGEPRPATETVGDLSFIIREYGLVGWLVYTGIYLPALLCVALHCVALRTGTSPHNQFQFQFQTSFKQLDLNLPTYPLIRLVYVHILYSESILFYAGILHKSTRYIYNNIVDVNAPRRGLYSNLFRLFLPSASASASARLAPMHDSDSGHGLGPRSDSIRFNARRRRRRRRWVHLNSQLNSTPNSNPNSTQLNPTQIPTQIPIHNS